MGDILVKPFGDFHPWLHLFFRGWENLGKAKRLLVDCVQSTRVEKAGTDVHRWQPQKDLFSNGVEQTTPSCGKKIFSFVLPITRSSTCALGSADALQDVLNWHVFPLV